MKVLQFTSLILFPATFSYLFYNQLTAELPDKNGEVLGYPNFDFVQRNLNYSAMMKLCGYHIDYVHKQKIIQPICKPICNSYLLKDY